MHPVVVQGLILVAVAVVAGGIGVMSARSSAATAPYTNEILQFGPSTIAIQDASKRSIVITSKGVSCSEPPPDVIGTLATQLSGKVSGEGEAVGGNKGALDGEAARQLQTAVEKLGERSQGIQALRDMMFRLCEALQNNGLDPVMYRSSMFHILGSLNFVVPFEQCSVLASKGGDKESVDSCFANVVKYANEMLTRLEKESANLGDIQRLTNQVEGAKSELRQYQEAFHYLYMRWHTELPPSALPDTYRKRLVEDIKDKRAEIQTTGTAQVPFYPPNPVEPLNGLPPVIVNDLKALSQEDAAVDQQP